MRRAVVGLVIGVLAILAAPAPGASRTPKVGILLHDGAPPSLLEILAETLAKLGYVEGKSVTIERRDADGKNDRLAALANELVRLAPDVILAVNTPATRAAATATSTIPIVMLRVGDPVRSGLVASLARPGGNVTGLSFNNADLGPKRIQLIRDIVPNLARVAVLSNADNPGHTPQIPVLQEACAQLGVELLSFPVGGPVNLPAALAAAVRARAGALFVLDDTMLTRHRVQIVTSATKQSLPIVSRYRDFAEAGALLAYGPSLPSIYARAAYYVDRILKGAKPSELPIEEPSEFDLVVNLRTARVLGLTVPQSLLLTANHVIH